MRRAGARLTPVRRRALEILLEAHRALGAYEVLERLRADGFGGQPPVAYRALEFLAAMGLVHRIRRLNAFAACMRPGEAHQALFLICRRCEALAEAPGARSAPPSRPPPPRAGSPSSAPASRPPASARLPGRGAVNLLAPRG